VPEHELDAPRPSEMKFDALSSEPETSAARGAIRRGVLASRPRDDWARGCASPPSLPARRPTNDFASALERRRHGRRPAHQRDRSRRTAAGGRVGEPKRGHQKGRGHIVGRENANLSCFGELPGRTGCRNANRRPRRSKRPPSRSPYPAGFFGNSGDEGRIDIQRLGQACLLDCAPAGAAGRRLSTSFRTVPYGSNGVQSCQGFTLDVVLLGRVVTPARCPRI
jgi:hypothetical protein